MKIPLSVFVVLLVGLSAIGNIACAPSQTPPPPAVAESSTSSSNRAHLALLNASAEQRASSLKTVITTAGETCDSVTRTFHQGIAESDEMALWNVGCQDGNTYVVQSTTTRQDQRGS